MSVPARLLSWAAGCQPRSRPARCLATRNIVAHYARPPRWVCAVPVVPSVQDLTEEELTKLREEVDRYTVEGDLRRFNALNIKRLKEIGCYRGRRHYNVSAERWAGQAEGSRRQRWPHGAPQLCGCVAAMPVLCAQPSREHAPAGYRGSTMRHHLDWGALAVAAPSSLLCVFPHAP